MDEQTLLAAKLFRGFAEPTRLGILRKLLDGPCRVTDLVAHLGCSQANVSGHLACLRDCGLVEGEPRGRAVLYRVSGDHVVDVLRAAEALLDHHGTHVDLCRNHHPLAASAPG